MPIHQLFPTIEQAQNNKDSVYSDHLPILVEVPLNWRHRLRIISMNTLGPNSASGLHKNGDWESDEEAKARYQRIATGLALSARTLNADVIHIQEAHSEFMREPLVDALGADWEISAHEANYGAMLTCHKKTRLVKVKEETFNARENVVTLTVDDKESGKRLDLHNVWSLYNAFPQQTEEQYRTLLASKAASEADISIIVGDSNSRRAPLDGQPRCIVSGAIPPAFRTMAREDGGYGLDNTDSEIDDFPDVGLYQGEDNVIHQLPDQVVDLTTGNLYNGNPRKEDLDIWPEYRMVLCLDHSFNERKVINDQTIFEYEEEHRSRLEDPTLMVRMAATGFNEKAIAVRFHANYSETTYESIKSSLQADPAFQFSMSPDINTARPFYTIFAPLHPEKLNLLNTALIEHTRLRYPILQQLDQLVSDLSRPRFGLRSAAIKITILDKLKDNIRKANPSTDAKGYLAIIQQWENNEQECQFNKVPGSYKNNDIIASHRNMFFSGRERPGVMTHSAEVLRDLKEYLNEQIPAASLELR